MSIAPARVTRVAAPSETATGSRLPFGLGSRLYLVAVFLMSLQLDVDQFASVVDSRFPPGDVVLFVAVVVAPQMIRFGRESASLLSLAFIAVLAYGVVLAIVYTGAVTTHAVVVKFLGGVVLAVWCLVTVAHVRAGLASTILRTWLAGMAVWAVVSYVDWRIADIVPVITHDLDSRFGGAQFDQNNAGVAFGVATVLMWRAGRWVFRSWIVRTSIFAVVTAAVLLTLSRTAFLAVACAVGLVLVVGRVGATSWLRYLAVGFVALAIGVATGAIGTAIDDFQDRPDNVSSRQTLIDDALDSYADSNGLGLGLGTQLTRQDQIVHNTPILLLVETSIVGLSFYLAFVVITLRAARRVWRSEPELGSALFAGLTVMIVSSLAIEALYQRQWWLLAGLCAVERWSAGASPDLPNDERGPFVIVATA